MKLAGKIFSVIWYGGMVAVWLWLWYDSGEIGRLGLAMAAGFGVLAFFVGHTASAIGKDFQSTWNHLESLGRELDRMKDRHFDLAERIDRISGQLMPRRDWDD